MARRVAKKRVSKKARADAKFDSNLQRIFVLVALIILNIILLFNVFLPVAAVIFSLIVSGIGMIIGGLVAFVFSLVYPFFPNSFVVGYINMLGISFWAYLFLSIAVFCFGGLLSIANYYVTKAAYKGILWYIKLNRTIFKKHGY
ncbi:MAG: DUF1700 domain-containing protein [Candidatus Pacearchaeota archaeon]|nr:DUF1700 domain-containing protein [Candidatus Pacearchaeota archaeon]